MFTACVATACRSGKLTGEKGVYTYNEYVAVSPSNWNALTYQDNNDLIVMDRISTGLFGYNYKFDSNNQIIDGDFDVEYLMASALTDVSSSVDAKWGIEEDETGRAWKITLRNDLKWENGDAIKADDFIYSMKEQLNPLFAHYRADSYYKGATLITHAKDYAKQGQQGWFDAKVPFSSYSTAIDGSLYFALDDSGEAAPYFYTYMGFKDAGYDLDAIIGFVRGRSGCDADIVKSMIGKTLAQIKADSAMKAEWDKIIGWWQTDPDEELDFFIAQHTFPEFSFDDVGFYKVDDYNFVLVLDKALPLADEDGNLLFGAAYNMSSLPLVHKTKYETSKQAPAPGSALWTSNYNSSLDTTMSYGPYKLTSFQTGKQFILEKNSNWYGYALSQFSGQYQTTKIVVDTIAEFNTAWMSFQKGLLDGVAIDVSIAADYKNSDRAYFTPDDFVGSIQLQSKREALENRQSAGINKTILLQQDFRKALSLSIDRVEYNTACTTSSLAGFGLFGPVHYYDVANGGVYRDTVPAKETMLSVYGFTKNSSGKWVSGSNVYDTVDAAYTAITGYNLTLARQLIDTAYDAAKAAGDISDTDKVRLSFGAAADTEAVQRRFNFLKDTWTNMFKGTKLEGKFEMDFSAQYGEDWAKDFRAGAYDICMGGWTGAAWDPGYFLLAYLDVEYRYAVGWDTTKVDLAFTVPGYNEDQPITMNLMDWYDCLNGQSESQPYDWSSVAVEEDVRLPIIAAIEKVILESYYTMPISYNYTASMISKQVEFISYEYNTFMGYGGLRYMKYNYDDYGWAKYVNGQKKGIINYK